MREEKGITLIELLITISILFIISSIIYGVLIGINKNFRQLSGNNNLQQEANLILTTIKNYQLKKSIYVVSYDSSKKVFFIGESTPTQQLGSSNLTSLTINDGFGSNILYLPNKKTIDTTKSKAITVHIELSNGLYKFDTIIKRY